jgi:factor associated with neutral sphingomyelinase activation
MTNSKTTTTSTQKSTERFSLILLEPGEIYFEDYLIYYHYTNSPLLKQQQNKYELQKGKLKVCSKSLVFEPIDINYPLIKFPLKSIEKISDFNDQNPTQSFNQDFEQIKKHFFYLKCKQITKLKENNKIAPYTCERVSATSMNEFYFQLIFTNVNDTLQLINQLHRANTLPFDAEEIMVNSIVKSRLMRIKFNLSQLDDVYAENILIDYEVYKIQPLCTNPGKIYLTNLCIYYKPFNNLESENIFKIKLTKIRYLIKRRYKLHKNIACEILFDNDDSLDGTSRKQISLSLDEISNLPCLYLTFNDSTKCNDFYEKLKQQLMNFNSKNVIFLNDSDLKQQENMLQKWRYGIISNYEYLMYLNLISDRSFNDLTQYPVYPWVLVDYKSAKIDLEDETCYRDLSKPVGALNYERLERLRKRYREHKQQNEQQKFLYGSHYSTPAFVLYYLVRECPEWQLCLQNGKFDQPDRLFHSISDTWRNCFTHDADVKELIPEFYDLNSKGKFLTNQLKLDFGIRQDGFKVDDVILPRWCNNSAEMFVQTMRDALESSYVSKNLHLWIDLIFGKVFLLLVIRQLLNFTRF